MSVIVGTASVPPPIPISAETTPMTPVTRYLSGPVGSPSKTCSCRRRERHPGGDDQRDDAEERGERLP